MTDINITVLIRGEHRWIWLYKDYHRQELLRLLGRTASNPDSGLTWGDVAQLTMKIRQEEVAP